MKELKDLLEPPFKRNGFKIFANDRLIICVGDPLEIEKPLCNELADFLTAALNSEWQRQFGGERWELHGLDMSCPKCKEWFSVLDSHNDYVEYNYCPQCGIKLLPSEEEK